jgi:hypothetical protein
MTPHEKAVAAINARLEKLQGDLRASNAETAQHFLVQAIVVTIGLAEALNDFIAQVGRHAQRRHGEARQASESLAARHAAALHSGRELLEKLKANPTDRAVRKEIELAQKDMAATQKALRRGANALQRELAPGLAAIDRMAEQIRKLVEAGQSDGLKRIVRAVVAHVGEFCAAQPAPLKSLVDPEAWEKMAVAELDQAAGFNDAFARAGFQTVLALEIMTAVLAENPPRTPDEATGRATAAASERLKRITARFATGEGGSAA